MNPSLGQLLLVGTCGMVLGIFYFGGLWLTVKRLPYSSRPASLTLFSYLGRLAVTVYGFWLLIDGSWERLLAVIAGFMVMRMILLRICKPVGNEVPRGQSL